MQTARFLGYGIAVIVLLGWSHIFFKHGVTNPILFWLPIADLAGLLLAQHVDVDSLSLLQSVESLEGLKYDHKAV